MADFTPMHAVDTVSNATDAALASLETRLTRVELLVRDTALQSARKIGGLLRDLETASGARQPPSDDGADNADDGAGNAEDDGAGNPASKPADPAALTKQPGAVEPTERRPRHRMI
jgi:hypothetical protein